jgi:hypothetical protein
VNATATRLSPITASRLTRHRSRVGYGVLAVALLASILTLPIGSAADWWPAVAFSLGPDLAVLYGIAPRPAYGQPHPRAVRLHNALHHFWRPLGPRLVAVTAGLPRAWLAVRSPGDSTSRLIARSAGPALTRRLPARQADMSATLRQRAVLAAASAARALMPRPRRPARHSAGGATRHAARRRVVRDARSADVAGGVCPLLPHPPVAAGTAYEAPAWAASSQPMV